MNFFQRWDPYHVWQGACARVKAMMLSSRASQTNHPCLLSRYLAFSPKHETRLNILAELKFLNLNYFLTYLSLTFSLLIFHSFFICIFHVVSRTAISGGRNGLSETVQHKLSSFLFPSHSSWVHLLQALQVVKGPRGLQWPRTEPTVEELL